MTIFRIDNVSRRSAVDEYFASTSMVLDRSRVRYDVAGRMRNLAVCGDGQDCKCSGAFMSRPSE